MSRIGRKTLKKKKKKKARKKTIDCQRPGIETKIPGLSSVMQLQYSRITADELELSVFIPIYEQILRAIGHSITVEREGISLHYNNHSVPQVKIAFNFGFNVR